MALTSCQSEAVLYDAILKVDNNSAPVKNLCPYTQKNPCTSSTNRLGFLSVKVSALGFSNPQKDTLVDEVKKGAKQTYNCDTFLQRSMLDDDTNTMSDLSDDIKSNS
jgi:hypothetical protein